MCINAKKGNTSQIGVLGGHKQLDQVHLACRTQKWNFLKFWKPNNSQSSMWRNSPLDMFSSGNLFPMINVGKLLHGEISPHEKCGENLSLPHGEIFHMRNVETNLSSEKFLHMRKVEKICHVEKFLHMRDGENMSSGKILHMINVEKNLSWSLNVKKILHV